MASHRLQCGGRELDLSRAVIMGVVNTTPDSFSDGGTLFRNSDLDLDRAMARVRDMVANGAAIIDIGGESTRPGAAAVSLEEEMDRVLPLVERIHSEVDVIISVDTSSGQLMTEATAAGAGLINDVRALSRDGALSAAVQSGLPVCLMHMQGNPENMQTAPQYEDVVTDVVAFLEQRIAVCQSQGLAAGNILLDPGFGFGKSVAHNLALLKGLPQLAATGFPVLVGLSRKSMIGHLIGRKVNDRLPASLALATMAVERGAHIIRTHDVAETADAVAMATALLGVDRDD